MVTVRPHALTHPARLENMAGQVMSPVRFLYAKAFTTQGPCLCSPVNAVGRLPPSAFVSFLTRPPPIRKSPARPPATAFNLPPNSTPQALDQAGPLHAGGTTRPPPTASGANNCLSTRGIAHCASTISRRRPPTTTENRADNATHHDFCNCYNFDVIQAQHLGIYIGTAVLYETSNFLNSLLHPAVASASLKSAYDSATPARRHAETGMMRSTLGFSVLLRWDQLELRATSH
jgi:hypothetical protein